MTEERGRRRVQQGVVISNKMDKTVVVKMERTTRHPLYGKVMRLASKCKAHDEQNACQLGDVVRMEGVLAAEPGEALARGGDRLAREVAFSNEGSSGRGGGYVPADGGPRRARPTFRRPVAWLSFRATISGTS